MFLGKTSYLIFGDTQRIPVLPLNINPLGIPLWVDTCDSITLAFLCAQYQPIRAILSKETDPPAAYIWVGDWMLQKDDDLLSYRTNKGDIWTIRFYSVYRMTSKKRNADQLAGIHKHLK